MACVVRQHSPYSADVREQVCQHHIDGLPFKEISALLHNKPCTKTISKIVRSRHHHGGAIVLPCQRQDSYRMCRRFGVDECDALNFIFEVDLP